MSFSQYFILTFVPLFIVVDSPGNLPFIISLTEGSLPAERYRVVHIATATATALGMVFLFFGNFILKVLGITIGAFAIAGGIIILMLAIKYMTTGRMMHVIKEEMIAVVPIGTPLVVGPATITTLLILSQQNPIYIVLLSFLANMAITWVLFMLSTQISRLVGINGLRAISKVFSLLLAAIAVSMVLNGLSMLNLVKIG